MDYEFRFLKSGAEVGRRLVSEDSLTAKRLSAHAWLEPGYEVQVWQGRRLKQVLAYGEACLDFIEEALLKSCLYRALMRPPQRDEVATAKELLTLPNPDMIETFPMRQALLEYVSRKSVSFILPTDYDNGRMERALPLVDRVEVLHHFAQNATGRVPSSAGGQYLVSLNGKVDCECEDHQSGTEWCKHALALAMRLHWEEEE